MSECKCRGRQAQIAAKKTLSAIHSLLFGFQYEPERVADLLEPAWFRGADSDEYKKAVAAMAARLKQANRAVLDVVHLSDLCDEKDCRKIFLDNLLENVGME